jgi:hypothetical protein
MQRFKLGWLSYLHVEKAWKALHFTMSVLEYGAVCWNPYREGQINELDRVQNKAAKFAHHRSDSNLETLAERKNTRICALF